MDLETASRRALLVWLASICAVGFVLAPVAFSRMASREAGDFLRPFFAGVDWFGVVTAVLLAFAFRTKRVRFVLAVSMGVAALVDRLWLAPKVAARIEPTGLYHGLSTGSWMLILVVGVVVLWIGRRA